MKKQIINKNKHWVSGWGQHTGPTHWSLVLLMVLLSYPVCLAQSAKFPLAISPSVRVRSTVMSFLNFQGIRTSVYIPYDYERNFQTIGIGPKVELGRDLAISYTPFLRYGYAYSVLERSPDGLQIKRVDKKEFVLDQQLWLTKRLRHQNPRWYKPTALAAGWGIVHTGKRFYINNGPINQNIRVETNTADVATIFGSVRKPWTYTVAAHYLYDGFATNRTDKMIMYSVTVGYKLLPFKSASQNDE